MQHRVLSAFALASLLACGSSPEGSTENVVPPVVTVDATADKATIEGISLFQAVKGDLVVHGTVNANPLPAVAGRPGLVRVYVAKTITGPLRLSVTAITVDSAGAEIARGTTSHSVGTETPSDDIPSSFYDVAIPETGFVLGGGLRIEVQEYTSLNEKSAALPILYPGADVAPIALPIRQASANLEVRFVPVRYTAEGEDLLPIISDDGLEQYRQTLLAMYPVSTVHVAMRAAGAVTWDQPISANGDGWSEALGAVLSAREEDAAPDDVYYVGLFRSRPSFGNYCRGGCVLGLAAGIPGPSDAEERAALAVGFDAASGAETVAHELGHVHGRKHSPCGGAAGPDRTYPNKDGSLDAIGWDFRDGTFYESGYDLMGYCNPSWVSAFTWRALADRVDAIRKLTVAPANPLPSPTPGGALVRPSATAHKYRMIHVDGNGGLRIGARTTRRSAPQGDAVTLRTAQGTSITGAYFGYDEIPGGYVLVPETAGKLQVESGAGLLKSGTIFSL